MIILLYVKRTLGARASCPGQRCLGTASSIMLRIIPHPPPKDPPRSPPLRPGCSRRDPSPGPALRSPRPRCCRRGRRRTPPAQGRAQQPQGPCAFHIFHAPARRCRPGCRRCSCRRRCAPFRSSPPRRMQPAPRSALRCPSSSRCALCRCWSRRAECTGPRETRWPGCHQTACKTPAYKSTRPHRWQHERHRSPMGTAWWPRSPPGSGRSSTHLQCAQRIRIRIAAPKQQQMQRQQVMPGLRALLVRPRVHLILQSRSLLHASNCYTASSYRGLVVVAVVRLAALVLGVAAVDLLVVGPKLSWQKTSQRRLAPPGTSGHFPWAVATRAPNWSSRRRSRSRLRPQHGQPRCAPPRKPQSHDENTLPVLPLPPPSQGPNGVSVPLAMGVARTAQMVVFLSIPSFAKPFCVQARKGKQVFSSRVIKVFGSMTCRQDQASEPGKRSTRTS